MKYLLLISICFLLTGCPKDENPGNSLTNDTLKQYFQYTLNDTSYSLMENDSVKFYPRWENIVLSSDTINFVNRFLLQIQVAHKENDQTVFDGFDVSFYSKFLRNAIDWNNRVNGEKAPILKENVFSTLFSTGPLKLYAQDCFDSLSSSIDVGIFFPFYKHSPNEYNSYYSNCLGHTEVNNYKQLNSSFIIENHQLYNHKKFGECHLLTGTFAVNLYYAPGATWADTLKLRNGRFKILISKGFWN